MKNLAIGLLAVAGVSIVLGIFSRVTFQPLTILPGSVQAQDFLEFANTCLLAAIALFLLEKKK